MGVTQSRWRPILSAAKNGDCIAMCALAALFGVVGCVSIAAAADERPWEIAPYRVHVTLAVNASQRPQADLSELISRTIRQRVDAALRPLWALDLNLANDAAMRRYCRDPQPIAWADLASGQRSQDKLLWLGVEAGPRGYSLTCREFDAYTRRWGPTLRRDVGQSWYLGEACFRLLADAFTPVARVQPPDDANHTQLVMKGGGLPRPKGPICSWRLATHTCRCCGAPAAAAS